MIRKKFTTLRARQPDKFYGIVRKKMYAKFREFACYKERMERMDNIFRNIPGVSIHEVDRDFRLIWTSIIDDERNGVSGEHCYELLGKRGSHCPECDSPAVFSTGLPISRETESSDGRILFIQTNPVKGKDGKVESIVRISTDVTGLRKTEGELKNSEEKFKAIFNSSRDALMTLVSNGRFTGGNPATVEMFGCRDELDFTSKTPADLSPQFQPDGESSESKAKRMMGSAMENGSHFFEWTHKRLDGQEFPTTVLLTRTELEGTLCLLATVRDITEQKKSENALKKSESRYRVLFEAAAEGIAIVDSNTKKFKYTNPALCRMLGYTSEEFVNLGIQDIHPKESLGHVLSEFEDQLAGRKILAPELPCLKKDGSVIYADIASGKTIIDGSECVIGFFNDVTERKKIFNALKESERKFRELVETLPIPIFEFNLNAYLTYANSESFRVFGYPPNFDIKTLNMMDLLAPEFRDIAKKNTSLLLSGNKHSSSEYIARKMDGTRFPMVVTPSIIADGSGAVIGFRGFLTDLSDQKKLEVELMYRERNEAIRTLAGGVAHDFNNMLASILGNISVANTDPKVQENGDLAELLNDVEDSAKRASGITRQLLLLSREGTFSEENSSFEKLVFGTTTFCLRGSQTQPRFNFPDGFPDIQMDGSQISRVVSNIVINARQSMTNGGILQVTGTKINVDENEIHGLKPGEYLSMSFTDSGPGISPEAMPHIFEQFFSTKQKGDGLGGSGLGLSTSQSIIRKHGGVMTVSSKPGQGATFTIYLPIVSNKNTDEKAVQTGIIKGHGNILVMDDFKSIQRMITNGLCSLGYTVQCADDGEAAIEKFRMAREAGTPFDAVIVDLTVPGGMGGVETSKRLREIDPNVRVIVSSGFSENMDITDFKAYGFNAALPKPYDAKTLSKVMSETINPSND